MTDITSTDIDTTRDTRSGSGANTAATGTGATAFLMDDEDAQEEATDAKDDGTV